VDLVRAAAARAGIEVEFVALPLEQLRPALKGHRADAAFLGVIPENLPLFDFSAPVLTTGGALYVRTPAPEPESLAAMDGMIVVTPRSGPLADYIKTNAPSVKLVLTTDYEESLTRVMRGEAAAAALNYHVGTVLAARLFAGRFTVPHRMFREAQQAVGVPKGEGAAFLSSLNSGLATIQADETWQQINSRWMGQ
jgi:polar amino acid transport system substrate-binding protein